MSKYRMTISVVKGDTLITDVYVAECPNMFEAMQKAARYAGFQLDEECGEYIKHISVNMIKEDQ